MKKCNEKMTDYQRELASENHNLIYKFAHQRGLSTEVYYDALAIGLCNAAMAYEEGRGEFSTLAFKCMENEVFKIWNSYKMKRTIPDDMLVSFDANYGCDECSDNISIMNSILDYTSYNEIEYNLMLEDLVNILDKNEIEICDMLMSGMIQSDIAIEIGCTKQSVNYHVSEIKEKILNYLDK